MTAMKSPNTEVSPVDYLSADTPCPRSHKRAYVPVEYEKRKELLELLNTDATTIKAAAAKLNINYSTAKNIVKLYRKDNRIHKLPKKLPLTLQTITTRPQTGVAVSEQAMYDAALRPFYHIKEAEDLLAKAKGKPGPNYETGASHLVTSFPAGQDLGREPPFVTPQPSFLSPQPSKTEVPFMTPLPTPQVHLEPTQGSSSTASHGRPRSNPGQPPIGVDDTQPSDALFNFMIYSPIVLGR